MKSQKTPNTLGWRHNGLDSVSNHQPQDCLLNRLFRRWSKKTSKLRVNSAVNSPRKWPVTRKMFPFDDVIMTSPLQASYWASFPGSLGKRYREISRVHCTVKQRGFMHLGSSLILNDDWGITGDRALWNYMVHCDRISTIVFVVVYLIARQLCRLSWWW